MSRVVESPDGYRWNVRPYTDDHLALGGHETALEPIMRSMCDPAKAFVNIGAHVGSWAIRMAPYSRHVFAIEANPATAHALKENIELNNLQGRVSVITNAMWDSTGEIFSMVDANNVHTGGSTRVVLVTETNNVKYTTSAQLDDFPWGGIGLIVMDVEGAEAHVLRGAKETIARERPNMIIELHEGHPGTDSDLRAQVYSVLDELNYQYASVDITGERLLCGPAENALDDPEPEPLQYSNESAILPGEELWFATYDREGKSFYG